MTRAFLRSTVLIVAFLGLFVASGCNMAFSQHRAEALSMLEQSRYGAAVGHYESALALVPEHAETLCDLAQCHLAVAREYQDRKDEFAAMREIDQAIDYYNRAIRSYPGFARALHGKNRALEYRGEPGKALETAHWAVDVVGPSLEQQLFLASEFAERGDADRALLAYKQAVAMEPQSSTAHWALGLYYVNLGRDNDAVPHIQQAYVLDPGREYIASRLRDMGAEVPVVIEESTRS